MADKKIFKLTIPNKFQTYLYAGVPILSACDGAVNEIVKKNNIGFTSKNESSKKLITNVFKLYKLNSLQRKNISINMKNLYKKRFDINNQTKKLKKIIFDEK